ncbi:hypothetical protein [Streptomyces armeniacus]|uniref:hypothetical protein n=1 Tax=Streptomyces armeniacus TaxID=83291 RepID=UPI001AD7EB86|nr:hypothetical protein [Streptomyces armeniacus]
MNDTTESLLRDVAARLQKAILARDCPAVVALCGHRTLMMSDYDYLRDEATARSFEHRAAAKAREIEATRWVLAVPQVWQEVEGGVAARAVSNHPLRPGEQEVITWMSCDADDGVDYGYVPYTRRPNREPVFDAVKVFTEPVRPRPEMPGFTLLTALMDVDDEGSSSPS